jgi:Conserved protein/domain typically associated with flavoprotein oxygenases, DIM6/NTAB family
MAKSRINDEKISWKPGNSVYPTPAVLVSCQVPGEKPNLITVAWCGNINSTPAMLSISVRPIRHSHHIIANSGEFVVNIPAVDQARAVDYCGVVSGLKMDKFEVTGLTEAPSMVISAPLVAECPINIECKVKDCIPLGSHDMFLAEVVATSVSGRMMDRNGKFHLDRANLLCFAHGAYYSLGGLVGQFGWSVRKKAPAGQKKGKK